MNILDTLNEVLAHEAADWGEADRELAKTVATELAKMLAQELAGQDVDEDELAIVKATGRNIASAATVSGWRVINQVVERLLVGVASKLAL